MFECEHCSKKFQYQKAAHQHMRDKGHYDKKPNDFKDQNELRCLDWVFASASNVHVAKDRAWFIEYTPFETQLGSLYVKTEPIRVLGIGTVELPTEASPNSLPERDPPPALRLTNVLHAPSVVCNIIGGPILADYNISTDFAGRVTKGYITDKDGRRIAFFDPSRDLLQVKLRDPPAGIYPLMREGAYMVINAVWPDSERAKWDKHEKKEEKAWLKKHYGDEFHFLREHGMSIYKDEDREDGRTLLRMLMRAERESKRRETERSEALTIGAPSEEMTIFSTGGIFLHV